MHASMHTAMPVDTDICIQIYMCAERDTVGGITNRWRERKRTRGKLAGHLRGFNSSLMLLGRSPWAKALSWYSMAFCLFWLSFSR